ncbi:MAG TPA: VOC family protein [Streptosporangiaceae bacterium]|nr:VOC family protein [Streptosporangiaceae bacterium]
MSEIRSLGYLRIESADPGAWREFGTRLLGLTEGRGPEAGAVYLRMDDFPARFVIVAGGADRLLASGWETGSQRSFETLADRLAVAGVPVKAGTAAELAARRVAGMMSFDDPSGHRLEVFWGTSLDNRPAFSQYGVSFVTGDYGMGHLVIPASDDAASMDFYTGLLGFRLRDTMAMAPELFGRPAGGPPALMRFLGVNPRHHSLALAPMTAASGCIHVMVEVASLDDVGRAMDRCTRRGGKLTASLGRHANDRMVSFYVRTPGGFDIEYGTGGLLVDDATWVSRRTTAISEWGHAFVTGEGTS